MRAIFLLLLFWVGLSAEQIESYHIDVTIHHSGSLTVQEKIVYDFGANQRHGIYRDIPHTIKKSPQSFPRDIGLSNFSVSIDEQVSPFIESKVSGDSGSNIRLKIGDAYSYITGQHHYGISYDVAHAVLGTDSGLDAVRWNAIGTGWGVPIQTTKVLIHLPHSLNQGQVEVSTFTGRYGSTTSQATHQWIDSQTLAIEMNNLASHEGLTFQIAFAPKSLGQSSQLSSSEALLLWLQKFWHWLFLGGFWFYLHNYQRVKGQVQPIGSIAVQYAPPKGMGLLKSGLIYDKFADNKDFAPAIVELAQQGYLKIINSSKQLKVEKIEKDSSSLSFAQKYLLDELLFRAKKSFVFSSSETKARKLQEGFSTINENLYEWSEAEKYMQKNPQTIRKSLLFRVVPIVMVFVALGIILGISIIGGEAMFMLGFLSIFFIVGISLAIFIEGILIKIFAVTFLFVPSIILVSEFSSLKLALLPYTFIVAIPFVIWLIHYYYKNMGAYTPKGVRAYAKLEGYREFIKRVKVDEIERRLKSDPEFLDKALPYAILFGYSDKWTEFYEVLNLSNPTWYSGSMHHIGTMPSDIQQASTIPSSASSSGGYSGGGGFSGGGGGGGGGGSW
ncbi:MAG: DUF2207 domain-containing protein [Epsilonproteobacteria bacterium]|nr:DUF2207 domain-containing protein [Campylobacterota bacterium]